MEEKRVSNGNLTIYDRPTRMDLTTRRDSPDLYASPKTASFPIPKCSSDLFSSSNTLPLQSLISSELFSTNPARVSFTELTTSFGLTCKKTVIFFRLTLMYIVWAK